MAYKQIFDTEGDRSQDDGTLFSLSCEFLEAARVLLATPASRVGFLSAAYYLLAHSAELLLKAYLHKCGESIGDLKKLSHDLEKLASRAREVGLPDRVLLDQILHLAAAYREKSFEYRTRRRRGFPRTDLLNEEIERLQSAVFERLAE